MIIQNLNKIVSLMLNVNCIGSLKMDNRLDYGQRHYLTGNQREYKTDNKIRLKYYYSVSMP
jgi:hypothetical protein